jgi:hypothetical protein
MAACGGVWKPRGNKKGEILAYIYIYTKAIIFI